MVAFIASFVFVVLAELGDKTQLLAMFFATRYEAWKVLVAIFIATILNHALAVLAGHFLTTVIPVEIISFIAALSFVFFGLWTIRAEQLTGEEKKEGRFGPIVTVTIAFFLAEMGDKTQLATISLAVEYRNMLSVLMGTTLGMVVADAFGIVVGVILQKHIPEGIIKWSSAGIFILFGLLGIYNVLSPHMNGLYTFGILAAIGVVAFFVGRHLTKKNIQELS